VGSNQERSFGQKKFRTGRNGSGDIGLGGDNSNSSGDLVCSSDRGFLMRRRDLAGFSDLRFTSDIVLFFTPGLAGPTREGRLAGCSVPSAGRAQNMQGS